MRRKAQKCNTHLGTHVWLKCFLVVADVLTEFLIFENMSILKGGSKRHFPLVLVTVVVVLASIVIWRSQNMVTSSPDGIVPIGGSFELTDHHGQMVTEHSYSGKYLLVFFGYTYCPDVCPMTLERVAATLNSLGASASKVQSLFVSVDVGRDTPEGLAEFLELFHVDIIGLTGTEEQIRRMANAYRIYFARIEEKGSGQDDYIMDHTSLLYFMSPDGSYITHFQGNANPAVMTEFILKAIDEA